MLCSWCESNIDNGVAMGTASGDPLCYSCARKAYPDNFVDDAIRGHDIWDSFQTIIDDVSYKPGWSIRTGIEDDGAHPRMWMQVCVSTEAEISFDVIEKRRIPWRGAKHYLSMHMCRNEIVSMAYHAIERAELHEVKEWFRYKGRSIFNPHLDPDVLADVASRKSSFNVRANAMTMEETS